MIIAVFSLLLVSILISGVLLRYILFWALSNKKVDRSNTRKIHQGFIPRLGGLAFFPAAVISELLVAGIYYLYTKELNTNFAEYLSPKILTLLFAGLLCYITGAYDDLRGIGYRRKFFFQTLCGGLLVAWGPKIDNLQGILNIYALHPVVSFLLSVFIVIFIINSINLIDGIDGLATGISGTALLYYGAAFIYMGYYTYAWVAFAMLGAIIPFFIYNIFGFRNKHQIFMGDTGATSLGLLLSFLSLSFYTKLSQGSCDFHGNPMILAFAPLMLPCLDTIRTFWHRLKIHKHPFKPDTNHIHHKLMFIGLSQHYTLLALLSVSIMYTFFNVTFSDKNANLILALDILSYTLLNICLTRRMEHISRLK